MRNHHRALLRGILGCALLASIVVLACFEEPVEESLEIHFLPNDRARIVARVEISANLPPENQAAADRVTALRTSLMNEADQWSMLFRSLQPIEERYTTERFDGELRIVERSAVIHRDELETLFRASSIPAFVSAGDGWAELAIYPGESGRATRQQREVLQERLDAWSHALERYFTSLSFVVAYLDQQPDRRRAVWSVIFDDFVDDSETEDLTESELRLTEGLQLAIEATWKVFEIEGEEAYSLQQIGYLVYDPFPSDVTVEVPGQVIASEGFRQQGGMLEIRRVGLWEAFESLREATVTNDPLAAWMKAAEEEEEPSFDFEAFLLNPVRLEQTPSSEEIVAALESELRPASLYRVRWRE